MLPAASEQNMLPTSNDFDLLPKAPEQILLLVCDSSKLFPLASEQMPPSLALETK